MLLSRVSPRAALPLCYGQSRPFQSSRAIRSNDVASHYDTLRVGQDATPTDIKKSFYALSKAHHPDHHPEDPQASKKFARISEAYSVLGTPAKRAAYDRDVLRLDEHARRHQHHQHHRHKGSYHSSGPAGGRPPSGLSRRRGTFHGPPPSFYRSGGWGQHGEKRKAAHESSTGGASASSGAAGSASSGAGPGTVGGMGPGQDPFGHRDDVPHFDQESHTRTHQNEDLRRAWRMKGVREKPGAPGAMFSGVWVVSGVLAIGVLTPVLFGGWFGKKNVKRTAGRGM